MSSIRESAPSSRRRARLSSLSAEVSGVESGSEVRWTGSIFEPFLCSACCSWCFAGLCAIRFPRLSGDRLEPRVRLLDRYPSHIIKSPELWQIATLVTLVTWGRPLPHGRAFAPHQLSCHPTDAARLRCHASATSFTPEAWFSKAKLKINILFTEV